MCTQSELAGEVAGTLRKVLGSVESGELGSGQDAARIRELSEA